MKKKLDIENLSLYEVDHIIPRSYIKDDSLDNKALVLREENQRKTDSLLLKDDIINKQMEWWKSLLHNDMMTQSKYYKLIRRKMFETDNRIKGLFELSEDRFNSYGMHRWGTIENLKQGFKTLARRSNEFKPEPKPERPTLHMPKEKDYNTNTIAGLKKYVNDCIVYKAAIYEIPKERVYFKDDINEWNYSWDVPAIYISDMDYYYNQQGYYPFCYDSKASKAAKSAMFRVESFCNELISIDEKPKNAELTIKWKHLGHNNYEIYVMCS